jgi:hypothetical protein
MGGMVNDEVPGAVSGYSQLFDTERNDADHVMIHALFFIAMLAGKNLTPSGRFTRQGDRPSR